MGPPSVAAIVFGISASVVFSLFLILLSLFIMYRRHQRALFILSLAQEEANLRRRNRKKTGLRRWEIESVCPEAIVSVISNTVSSPTVHSQQEHPKQYHSAMVALRSANLLPDLPLNDFGDQTESQKVPKSLTPPPLAASHLDTLDTTDFHNLPAQTARSFIVVDVDRLSPPQHSDLSNVEQPSDHCGALPEDDPLQTPCVPSHVATLPRGDEICVICLDDVEVGHRVRVLPCGHLYHSQCIRMWLRRKNSCPCCAERVVKRRSRKRDRTSTTVEEILPIDAHNLDNLEDVQHGTDNVLQDNAFETAVPVDEHAIEPVSLTDTSPGTQWPERPVDVNVARRVVRKSAIGRHICSTQVHTSRSTSSSNSQNASEQPQCVIDESRTCDLLIQLRGVPLHDSANSLNASSIAGWSDVPSDTPDTFDSLVRGTSSSRDFCTAESSSTRSVPEPLKSSHV